MRLVGITGVIGSGKTTVGHIIEQLGYSVYDMDIWCRKMYNDPCFLLKIKNSFPSCFEDLIFNKKKLREIVFKDPYKLQELESLTHPYLKEKFKSTIYKHRFDKDIIFIQSALLFQMGLDKFCSDIIITTTPLHIIKKRVITRDNVESDQVDFILQKQYRFNSFSKGYIIDTNQKLTTLKVDVIQVLKRIIPC